KVLKRRRKAIARRRGFGRAGADQFFLLILFFLVIRRRARTGESLRSCSSDAGRAVSGRRRTSCNTWPSPWARSCQEQLRKIQFCLMPGASTHAKWHWRKPQASALPYIDGADQ